MSLFGLFLLFARISLFTFGGGYAMVAFFQSEIVAKQALMQATEFANLVALAQVTSGPIGFNAATYVGMTCGDVPGALAASFGVIIPSFVIALLVAVLLRRSAKAAWMKLLMRGIRPCVIGIIAAAVVFFADTSVFTSPLANLLRGKAFGLCWQGALVFAVVVFVRLKWKKSNPVWALLVAAALGWALYL